VRHFPARRIVCLTEETVETLYLLGEQDRIVGVSGYAVRPPQVRREKPRVSAFTSADIAKIRALEPDLVLLFSDIQAMIAAELARAGLAVYVFNQRDVAGIFSMIQTLGALIGCPDKADELTEKLHGRIDAVAAVSQTLALRPRVYFEEWDDPLITGIGWVSELIEIAGGDDIFTELRGKAAAKDRVVTADEVAARMPDIILASWCGKKVRPEKIRKRPGWTVVPAVIRNRIVEIKSPLILQPGPAALTDGLDAIRAALR
jgi:iron complex transport system substrate-binding protein